MNAAFEIAGPKGVGAENGDLAVRTKRGTIAALIYVGHGPQGRLVAQRRAEAVVAALTALEESCAFCAGIRDDGELCACTVVPA